MRWTPGIENAVETTSADGRRWRTGDLSECCDVIGFICAVQLGFMSGQNAFSDGGIDKGLF